MRFDEVVADRLLSACEEAAHVLEGQRGARQGVVDAALREFRGLFAERFRTNTDAERVSRSAVVAMVDDLARQVRDAKVQAARQQQRLDAIAAWDLGAAHALAGSVDAGPRPEQVPAPAVVVSGAWQQTRSWSMTGARLGQSSADPDELDAAASVFGEQDQAGEAASDRVIAGLGGFEDSCSWVYLDADAVRAGLRRFLDDNHEDQARLGAIAAAFRAAGGPGVLGRVAVSDAALALTACPETVSGEALLALLGTASATDLKALSGMKGWQTRLQWTTPGVIAAWWAGLNAKDSTSGSGPATSTQQALLLGTFPALFGNLNGIPFVTRDTANRIWLNQQLAQARATLAEAEEHAAQRSIDDPGLSPLLTSQQTRVAALESIQTSLDLTVNGASRFLVGLTGDVPPLAQISIGNLDTATEVTYAIPGMNITTTDTAGWVDPSQNVYDELNYLTGETAGAGSFAVVAWIGYKTPPVPVLSGTPDFGVIQGDYARVGALRLGLDLAGFVGTRPDATLNIVAHSYGTTTASDALARSDVGVNNVVLLASAGIENAIPDAGALHAEHVYAGQAPNVATPLQSGDPWAWTGRAGSFRQDPTDASFGATVFGADGETDQPDLHPTTSHNALANTGADDATHYGYLDEDTESLWNTAAALTGHPERLTADQSHPRFNRLAPTR